MPVSITVLTKALTRTSLADTELGLVFILAPDSHVDNIISGGRATALILSQVTVWLKNVISHLLTYFRRT